MVGADGNLEGADLIDDIPVQADCVRRAGKHVDALALHDKGRHIVGDDRHVKAHVMADRGSQARALKIRSRLRAEQPQRFPGVFRFFQHHAHNRLAEALGHDGSLLREHRNQILCNLVDLGIPGIVCPDNVGADCLVDARARLQRLLCRCEAAGADLFHALFGRRAGVCNARCRLLKKRKLLFFRLFPALPRGKRHAHAGGCIRSRALSHHVADGLHDLDVRPARHKFHVARIYAPVENFHRARVVPCDIFILQHKG